MIDARDLSYKLLDLWREKAMVNNDAGSIIKGGQVQPVFVQTDQGYITVIDVEITEQGIVLVTGDSK